MKRLSDCETQFIIEVFQRKIGGKIKKYVFPQCHNENVWLFEKTKRPKYFDFFRFARKKKYLNFVSLPFEQKYRSDYFLLLCFGQDE